MTIDAKSEQCMYVQPVKEAEVQIEVEDEPESEPQIDI